MTDLFETVRPRYGAASISDILPGALAALGVPGAPDPLGLAETLSGVRRIAVLLVDGFGWFQWPLAAPHAPTVADLVAGKLGSLTPITCGFPSTTPTSLASVGTGAPPGAHGLVGFTVNVPGTTTVLNHIDWWGEPDPWRWQPLRTQFEVAAAAGVTVRVASRGEFAGSGLTVSAYRGAPYLAAGDPESIAATMLAGLAEVDGPTLVYGYHADLDRVGHVYGVDSAEWRVAAADVDRMLTKLVDGLPADAALLVTADHGQLDVPAHRRLDIAADPRLSAGVRIVAGEPRVRFLHTEPGAAGDVIAAWREVLDPGSWVVSRAEAVAQGWFGPVPEGHLSRVGDVVAVCATDQIVLSTGTERAHIARLVAFHGAATAVEMTVPLAVVRP